MENIESQLHTERQPEMVKTPKEEKQPETERQPKAEQQFKTEGGGDSSKVEDLIEIIDRCVRLGDSRIKIDVVEGQVQGAERRYHHGRCDIGSPWACGAVFDVLEE